MKDILPRKEYLRKYQLNWLKNRRTIWLQENGPCKQCGSNERLEVDHIIRDTKVDHKVWSWTKVKRENELKKCQVLCYECHKQKTIKELSTWTHGTAQGYKHCHCVLCKNAHKLKKREQRRKRFLLTGINR